MGRRKMADLLDALGALACIACLVGIALAILRGC